MHAVTPGYTAGCAIAEGSTKLPTHFRAMECRGCLTAMVAHAVNDPRAVTFDGWHGGSISVLDSALMTVRDTLDETDPLRVRAEQVLLPLLASVPVSTVTTE